jgi:hypothetical protein
MPMTIHIFGPRRGAGATTVLWEADAEVVSTPKFVTEAIFDPIAAINVKTDPGVPSVRPLFLGEFPTSNLSVFGQKPVLVPGGFHALCRVTKVTLHLGRRDFVWTGASAFQPIPLYLQAEPADWVQLQKPGDFPKVTLLDGEVKVDDLVLAPGSPPLSSLLAGFKTEAGPDGVTALVLNASGFAFRAKRRLPWMESTEARVAPWQAFFPFPVSDAAELRVELARGHLTPQEKTGWVADFGVLRRLLSSSPTGAPAWATLDLTPAEIPKFAWRITGSRTTLQFDAGEVTLSLAQAGLPGAASMFAPALAEFADDRATRGGKPIVKINIRSVPPDSAVVTGTEPESAGATGKWTYRLARTKPEPSAPFAERAELIKSLTHYDPLALAERLRRQLGLAAPTLPDPLRRIEPLLWSAMRLEDGWAQIPFLNVTEEAYVHSGLANASHKDSLPLKADGDPSESLFRGAAIFTNDVALESSGDAPNQRKANEQPWSVTLLDALSFEGVWQLPRPPAAAPEELKPEDWPDVPVDLTLQKPEAVVDGFIWLGTEPPSPQDALPSLDNWVAALQSLPLRSPDAADPYVSPHEITFETIAYSRELPGPAATAVPPPQLGDWHFQIAASTTYEPLLREFLEWKPKNNFLIDLPLVWRRHPAMPCAQALPLTQNLQPPSYPSPSRELAPFELPLQAAGSAPPVPLPAAWRFGVNSPKDQPGIGASVWPTPQPAEGTAALQPAAIWRFLRIPDDQGHPLDIPMPELGLASLSVPGLYFDPTLARTLVKNAKGPDFLRLQYRFDLPYTDEINAFAELPRDENKEPPAEPAPPPPPIVRREYAAFWQKLREKGLLAAADAVAALEPTGTGTAVVGLVEPFQWRTAASVDHQVYPGSLTFAGDGGALVLSSVESSLLRGIQGSFTESGGFLALADYPSPDSFEVIAGSMSARVQDGMLRDQRGLSRGASTVSPAPVPKMVKTPLRRTTQGASLEVTLFSLLGPLNLDANGRPWRIWFCDVPATADGIGGFQFHRATTLSKHAQDVNDPEAVSPDHSHLTGYEWRLADDIPPGNIQGGATVLQLAGLHVFPLSLEHVAFGTADVVVEMVIAARLQLPRAVPVELTGVQNTVLIRFVRDGDTLKLKDISLPSTADPKRAAECLCLLSDENLGPVLRLTQLTPKSGGIEILGAVEFVWLNALWRVPLDTTKPAILKSELEDVPVPLADIAGTSDVGLAKVELCVGLAKPENTRLSLTLSARWGNPDTDLCFEVLRTEKLLGPVQPAISANLLVGKRPPYSVEIDTATDPGPGRTALQVGWKLAAQEAPSDKVPRHLFPGMRLTGVASGFASLAFDAVPAAVDTGELDKPLLATLRVSAAAFEALFPCRWNRAVQALTPAEVKLADLFHSSAGDLVANYTLEAAEGDKPGVVFWRPQLLFNGWLEIVNLISWPLGPQDVAGGLIRTIEGFGFASSVVPPEAARTLDAVAAQLKAGDARAIVHLEGHADITAAVPPFTNYGVSRDRAQSVRKELVTRGVDPKRLVVVAYGETRLLTGGTTPADHQRNRRVEIRRSPSAVLPALADGKPLNHLRHTARILFNQHALARRESSDVLPLGPGQGDCLLDLKGSWQFLATVEHSVADVELAKADAGGEGAEKLMKLERFSRDRRWSTVQEVRLASPGIFGDFLKRLRTFFALDLQPKSLSPVRLPDAVNGWAQRAFLEQMVAVGGELSKLPNTLIVEASAPFLLRPTVDAAGGFTDLQLLPSGAQRGVVSTLAELDARPDGSDPWHLLTLPFLGRLQDSALDDLASHKPGSSDLQLDPILRLEAVRQTRGARPSPVLLALASRQVDKPLLINISNADSLDLRSTRELNAASLIEAWFRLQHPPKEEETFQGLPPAMAALPARSPGRLSRHAALDQAFSARRASLPPSSSAQGVPADELPAPNRDLLVWRHLSLLAVQGVSDLPSTGDSEVIIQGFFFGGLQLQALRTPDTTPAVLRRYPAVTALPANLSFLQKDGSRELNPQPVSFAVSPYFGLDFEAPPTGPAGAEVLVSAELLAAEAFGATRRFQSIGSQLWFGEMVSKTPAENDAAVRFWASETRSRLAADSPLAIVRVRAAALRDAGGQRLVASFRFLVIDSPAPTDLAPLTRALRAAPAELRFQEGQFTGSWIPQELLPLEAAPPQTDGVQPFWELKLPDEPDLPAQAPRSLSALRLSVRHYVADGDVSGIVGPASGLGGAFRLWWATSAHQVTFALPKHELLLPPLFRAAAIQSLLPAPGRAPLPPLRDLDVEIKAEKRTPATPESPALDPFKYWQPLLPDAYRCVVVGARPGVPFRFRNHLQTQFLEDERELGLRIVSSGSVPVQHRFPRPLPLPGNSAASPALAQQPWPAIFQPERLPEASRRLIDNATFDLASDANAFGVQIQISEPDDGVLRAGTADRLQIEKTFYERKGGKWQTRDTGGAGYEVTLKSGDRSLRFLEVKKDPEDKKDSEKKVEFVPEKNTAPAIDSRPFAQILADFLSGLPHGAPLVLEIRVTPTKSQVTGFAHTLRYRLRVGRPGFRALPLAAVVVPFEDPEYNRRLTSTPAQRTGVITVQDPTKDLPADAPNKEDPANYPAKIPALLATDRREYNRTSTLYVAWFATGRKRSEALREEDSKETKRFNALLAIRRIRQDGTTALLKLEGAQKPGPIKFLSSSLKTIALGSFPELIAGDALELILAQAPEPEEGKALTEIIVLRVDIVADPVIPAPEAAYALLQRDPLDGEDRVHCTRFAWSPLADRIDLLDPADLAEKTVRRRAVFQWQDTIRVPATETSSTHATHRVQKINFNGSTHFPSWKPNPPSS